MTHDFSGKVVLITGGTGALGRAVAQAFGTSNATTVVTYIVDEEMEDVKTKIKTITELVKADITKEDQAKKLVSHVIETYDRIDVLINVVGGYLGGKSVAEVDETEWDKMMNMNLKSAFLISKHVIPLMLSAKHGKIVHISSRTGLKSDGYDSAYSASKS
ncbi:MAG TPA: SDR family NAD(P)-dependent oxidoreductase, partial [Nitrososphaeraceae archaeon]|nr:SDR family NAD(P)-dependent oxidoreductase [Nitrososphaeraceae archaeon]